MTSSYGHPQDTPSPTDPLMGNNSNDQLPKDETRAGDSLAFYTGLVRAPFLPSDVTMLIVHRSL